MSNSRFKGIFETAKDTEALPGATLRGEEKITVSKNPPTPSPLSTLGSQRRSKGKSSNPDFTQALAYIKKSTYKDVKKALLDEPTQDFSDLVENLLSRWLRERK